MIKYLMIVKRLLGMNTNYQYKYSTPTPIPFRDLGSNQRPIIPPHHSALQELTYRLAL